MFVTEELHEERWLDDSESAEQRQTQEARDWLEHRFVDLWLARELDAPARRRAGAPRNTLLRTSDKTRAG
jgi:hypothetical protein